MSSDSRVWCDFCGRLRGNACYWVSLTQSDASQERERDMCPACALRLLGAEFLDSIKHEPVEEKPEEEKP